MANKSRVFGFWRLTFWVVALGIILVGASVIYVVAQNRAQIKAAASVDVTIPVSSLPEEITPEYLAEIAFDTLLPQMVIGTLPELSANVALRRLGVELPSFRNALSWNINHKYDRLMVAGNYNPFGGVIIYEANFGNLSNVAEVAKYVSSIRQKYTMRLRLLSNSGESVLVEIEPLIVSDCDPSDFPADHYCRYGTAFDRTVAAFGEGKAVWERRADAYRMVAEAYVRQGLHSPLAPSADYLPVEQKRYPNIEEMALFTEAASLHLHAAGVVPTLKHFGYDGAANLHELTYQDDRSLGEFEQGLLPYDTVEELGFPYFIMTTHFSINALDPGAVATESSKVYDYIRSRFPNAVIMADELSMKGYSTQDNMSDRVEGAYADVMLVQGGNLSPEDARIEVYQGLKNKDSVRAKESISRMLMIKQYYGLMQIYRRVERSSNGS